MAILSRLGAVLPHLDLRPTYVTRLSAGSVADERVTHLLRQSDAKVFKQYSQMKREALAKLNGASERHRIGFRHSFGTVSKKVRELPVLSTTLPCRNKHVPITQRGYKRSVVVSKCRPVLRAGSIEVEFLDHCSGTLDRQDGTVNFRARP